MAVRGRWCRSGSVGRDDGADSLTTQGLRDGALALHAEDHHRQLVLHAQGEGGRVGYLEALLQHLAVEQVSPGLKRGGTLVVVRPEVELVVTASDIPEQITVDLTGKQIGDTIHISDVALPAGVKPTIDRDFVIATVKISSAALSEAADEAADAEAAPAEKTED